MQEQRRLQRHGKDVAHEDGDVQPIQLAGVLKRVQRKRNQAEHEEVRGLRRGPAPEEHVKPKREVHQRN